MGQVQLDHGSGDNASPSPCEAGGGAGVGVQKGTKSKNRVGLVLILSLLFVALVVALSSFTGTRADLNDLKKNGVPLDDRDLAKASPPDADNALSYYVDGINKNLQLVNDRNRFDLREFYPGPIPDSARENTLRAAALQKPSIDLYRKGAALSRCYIATPIVDQSEDTIYHRPNLGYLRLLDVTEALCGNAQTEMLQGDKKAAMNDLALAQNETTQLARNSGTDSFDAWTSQARQFHQNWMYCGAEYKDDPVVVKALAQMIQQPYPMASIKDGVAGDFPYDMSVLMAAQKDPFGYKVHNLGHSEDDYTDNSVLMRMAVNQMIHETRLVFDSLPRDPNDWQGLKTAFQKGRDDLQAHWPANKLLRNPFSQYMFLCDQWASTLASRRLAICSANLLLYRLDHKSAPDALPNLGENSIDPLSGKPFIYHKVGNAFELRSVGLDGNDDSGKILPKGHLSDDIIYNYAG